MTENVLFTWRLEELVFSLQKKKEHRGDLRTVFRYKKKIHKRGWQPVFFSVHWHGARSNGLKWLQGQCRLDIKKAFLCMRVVQPWNRLPGEAVESSSLEVFKSKLHEQRVWWFWHGQSYFQQTGGERPPEAPFITTFLWFLISPFKYWFVVLIWDQIGSASSLEQQRSGLNVLHKFWLTVGFDVGRREQLMITNNLLI